jgi:hypothetical protein
MDGLGWEEAVFQSEDGIGIVGRLDPERFCLEYVVEVASWGDWGWVECWRQLGVKTLAFAFTEGALSLAHEIWGVEVDLVRSKDVLSSYKKACDISVCHVPSESCLTSYFPLFEISHPTRLDPDYFRSRLIKNEGYGDHASGSRRP